MVSKVALGFLVILSGHSICASALQPVPVDLRAELSSAALFREIVPIRSECLPGKSLCERVRYEVVSSKTIRGKQEAKSTVETSERLKVGQKYLQLVTSVKISPKERSKTEMFFPVFRQSSFANNGKGDQEWILLPRNVDAEGLGAVRLKASICLEEMPDQSSLLLCDYASALRYTALRTSR